MDRMKELPKYLALRSRIRRRLRKPSAQPCCSLQKAADHQADGEDRIPADIWGGGSAMWGRGGLFFPHSSSLLYAVPDFLSPPLARPMPTTWLSMRKALDHATCSARCSSTWRRERQNPDARFISLLHPLVSNMPRKAPGPRHLQRESRRPYSPD